jgi:hypothetical protein
VYGRRVAQVPHPVKVAVALVGIGHRSAVVEEVENTVAVPVLTGVARPVPVAVLLARV